MLQVTAEANAVLREARQRNGAPPEAGLRVRERVMGHATKMLEADFQDDPVPTDQTIETPDLRVFIAQELIERLSDRVLDVTVTPDGPTLTLR